MVGSLPGYQLVSPPARLLLFWGEAGVSEFSISASIIKWRFILKLKIGCAKACDTPSRTESENPRVDGRDEV